MAVCKFMLDNQNNNINGIEPSSFQGASSGQNGQADEMDGIHVAELQAAFSEIVRQERITQG
jgi:hypothetical protein